MTSAALASTISVKSLFVFCAWQIGQKILSYPAASWSKPSSEIVAKKNYTIFTIYAI